LDVNDYGIFCYSEFYTKEIDVPITNGIVTKQKVITDASDPASVKHETYGVRYNELLSFIISALSSSVIELQSEVAQIKETLNI